MDKTNKIIHKRSSVILENGKAKLPTTDQLEYGELAINFAKGAETISFKNNNDEIVSITTSTTLEGIIESNMQNVQASIDAINQTIDENEEVIARALTDLDERIKSTVEIIDGIQNENDTLEDRIDTKLADKVDKTTFETLAGRVETNEGEITKLKGLEQAYKDADTAIRGEFAAADTALEGRVNTELAKKANQSDFETLAGRVDVVQGTDTGKSMRTVAAEEAATAVAKVVASADTDFDTLKEIADWILNDKTGATALQNDVADLKDVVDGYTGKGAIKSVVEAIDTRLTELEEGVIENEEIVATALTDLDERLNNIPNEFAAADTALKNELTAAIDKKADASAVAAFDSRINNNASAITALQTADTAIRGEFAAADTALKNELNGAIANKADKSTLEAIDTRLTDLETGVIENEQVIAGVITDLDERLNYVYDDFEVAYAELKDEITSAMSKKANTSVVTALADRVETNEGEITKLKGLEQAYKDADTALKNELNGEIAKKADASAVAAFDNRINNNASAITALQTAIDKKVDASAVATFDSRITNNENTIKDNEEIVATALNDLDRRMTINENTIAEIEEITITLQDVIEENEEITANLFAEMDSKILELEEKLKNTDIDGGEF